MSIHLNSRLRVLLPFVDVLEDGTETPIDLSAVAERSVRIIKPDGSELSSPTLTITNPAEGEAHWDAEANVLDQRGVWRAQGIADGYRSAPVSWKVEGNP